MQGPKLIYLLLAKDKSVKVGITKNFKQRLACLRTTSGKEILKTYTTDYCSNASEIEAYMKAKYSKRHILGEWFDTDYETAKQDLQDAYKKMSRVEKINDKESNESLEDLIDFVTSYSVTINSLALSDVCEKQIVEEINSRLIRLNHYLIEQHSQLATGCVRRFLGIAYKFSKISNAQELMNANIFKLLEILSYERAICECIDAGIEAKAKDSDIYNDCLEMVSELAYLQAQGG